MIIARHIPNFLTLARIGLILPFLFFVYQKEYELAFYVFFVAGLTDSIDGWFARLLGCQSVFGSFLDPLADKLLIATSFIALAMVGILPWWLVILVFLRDLTISIGVMAWFKLIKQKITFEPTKLSKLNTLLQITLVCTCMFELGFFPLFFALKPLLIFLTALTTLASYIDYVWTWSSKAVQRTQKFSHE